MTFLFKHFKEFGKATCEQPLTSFLPIESTLNQVSTFSVKNAEYMRTVNQKYQSLPKIKMKTVTILLFFGTLTASTPVRKNESLYLMDLFYREYQKTRLKRLSVSKW